MYNYILLNFRKQSIKKRKISNTEKALLLIERLQTGDCLHFVNTLYFPETIDNSKIAPILDFDRGNQKKRINHYHAYNKRRHVEGDFFFTNKILTSVNSKY